MLINFSRVISCSLSPNVQFDDFWLAVKTLFMPWFWKTGKANIQVENWFKEYLKVKQVALFNSGRSALFALLKSFDIGAGDEVIVQAFTCVAVPNSVLWTGAKPIYTDIDASFNLDPNDVIKKITKKTKVVIVQHTFGIPGQIDKLLEIAKKYKLIVIEDCAHSLGATFKGQKIGTFGDAAFFSFGRDKVISSVWGGLAIINSKYNIQNIRLKEFQKKLDYPTYFWILQQILHPILFYLILPIYNLDIGKLLLFIFQHLQLLSFPVYPEEKQGKQPVNFPKKYPNALAQLLLNQLSKLEQFNESRRETVSRYHQELINNKKFKFPLEQAGAIYLRLPILAANRDQILARAKENGILLGNWYHNVIDPTGVDYQKINYKSGSCPKAELVARSIINLPTTNLTQGEKLLVVNVLNR